MLTGPMSYTLQLLFLALLCLLATACTSTGDAAQGEADSLVGEWSVVSIAGAPVIDGSNASLRFDADGRFGGDTSVNAMNGTWQMSDGALSVSGIATTRRAGRPELMDQESRLLDAIERVRRVEHGGETLAALGEDGTVLLSARRSD